MIPQDVINIATLEQFNQLKDSLNLSDRQRDIFTFKYSRLWRNIDIAEELEISADTVAKELSAIRTKLLEI